MRIDSHQHFWIFDSARDSWMKEDMQIIRQNFLPNDISQILKDNDIDGLVAVQKDQSLRETAFLVELSQVYKVIKAVVGWVDIQADDLEEHLQDFSKYPVIKGFRYMVEAEEDPNFLMRDDFQRGIKVLAKNGFTYDLLIHPRHYASTLACVSTNPQQRFILDHMAKPSFKPEEFEEWQSFIEQMAMYPNVYCKISALLACGNNSIWKAKDLKRYITHVISCFGKERVCFCSGWPITSLSGTYSNWLQVLELCLSDFSSEELRGFWGDNAVTFYGLE